MPQSRNPARLTLLHRRIRADGTAKPAFVVVAAIAAVLAAGGIYAFYQHVRGPVPVSVVAPAPAAAMPSVPAAAPTTVGFVDSPSAEAVAGTRIAITGWALDPAGISGVAVHVDGVPHAATIGIARPDVAQSKPGLPDSARSGFSFEDDFADL